MIASATRWVGLGLGVLAILGAGSWTTLALWFRLAPEGAPRLLLAGGMLVLTGLALAGLGLRQWWLALPGGVAVAVVLGLWLSLVPSNDRDWSPDVARTAFGQVEGDILEVHNVRDFTWRSEEDVDAVWHTRRYDLSRLTGADLVMSYWSGEAIAHTIISFGFEDGRHLAFSIEIRRQRAQVYSALGGFFRNYELAFIAAEERDVIGVRTNMRGEDVRIYRLRMSPARVRALLLEYIAEANDLAREPSFYNTLTTNCTTQIFRMVRAVHPDVPLDYRILIAGRLPDFVYELGALDTRLPFPALRERGRIAGRASSDDPAFSALIRQGVPDPRAPVP